MSDRKRVAVLISGRGSNMQSLVEAAISHDYPAQIVGVVSNKSDAAGLEFAASRQLPTAVFSIRDHGDKAKAERAMSDTLRAWNVDLICLAGFMRLLSAEFCAEWQGQILNIHPSLLPEFPGLDTHARALDAGVKEHGCTVHFVTEGMDEGPIIDQARVPVHPDDTPDTLSARVLIAEHRLYPAALAKVASGETPFPG